MIDIYCTLISNTLKNMLVNGVEAIQIASAIQWKADLFASADLRQIISAKEFGLKIKRV